MATHTTTQATAVFGSPAGAAIAVAFACDDNGNPGTTATCTDDKGNSYSSLQVSATGNSTGVRTCLFYCLNPTQLAASDKITVTHGAVVASAMQARAVFGILTSGALDVSNTNVQAGTSAPTSNGTGTLSQANEVIIAAIGVEAEGSALGGTLRDLQTAGYNPFIGTSGAGAASNISVQFQFKSVNDTASVQGGYSSANESRDWACVIGGFKAITGGTSLGDPKIMVNGTETSVVLSTANALYTKLTDSNQYPSNAAAIGMRSSGTTADTFLYECGVLVAYDASKGPMALYRQRRPIDLRV